MNKPVLSKSLEMSLKGILYMFPEITEMILFGSRATGKVRIGSDLDIFVDAIDKLDKICYEIWEEACIVPVDVITPEILEGSPELAEEIEEHGIDLIAHFGLKR